MGYTHRGKREILIVTYTLKGSLLDKLVNLFSRTLAVLVDFVRGCNQMPKFLICEEFVFIPAGRPIRFRGPIDEVGEFGVRGETQFPGDFDDGHLTEGGKLHLIGDLGLDDFSRGEDVLFQQHSNLVTGLNVVRDETMGGLDEEGEEALRDGMVLGGLEEGREVRSGYIQ